MTLACENCEAPPATNEHNLCKSCYQAEFIECEACQAEVANGDVVTCDSGEAFCEECYSENFTPCSDCGCEVANTDVVCSEGGEGYCASCYDDNFTTCEVCRCEVSNDDSICSEGGETFCESCYCDIYTRCDGCGCEVLIEECTHQDHGSYCEGCATDNIEIDTPEFWSGSDKCKETGSLRKYGVELETSNSSGYVDWLDQAAFGATEDGSVSGMEFVSAPLYGDDGLRAIRQFCQGAKLSHFQVNNKCGFHLHVDLTNSTPAQRKAIALAYHYTREIWHKFIDSRRRDTFYSKLNIGYWDHKDIIEGYDKPKASTRYIWVNWEAFDKHSTVEIRSHHGTVDAQEVCNWVKAHVKFIDVVSNMTVGQITHYFGNEDVTRQFAELSLIWEDAELSSFYGKKLERVRV